jgi:hypothetical protein
MPLHPAVVLCLGHQFEVIFNAFRNGHSRL